MITFYLVSSYKFAKQINNKLKPYIDFLFLNIKITQSDVWIGSNKRISIWHWSYNN